jgi:hypothetical protein
MDYALLASLSLLYAFYTPAKGGFNYILLPLAVKRKIDSKEFL